MAEIGLRPRSRRSRKRFLRLRFLLHRLKKPLQIVLGDANGAARARAAEPEMRKHSLLDPEIDESGGNSGEIGGLFDREHRPLSRDERRRPRCRAGDVGDGRLLLLEESQEKPCNGLIVLWIFFEVQFNRFARSGNEDQAVGNISNNGDQHKKLLDLDSVETSPAAHDGLRG